MGRASRRSNRSCREPQEKASYLSETPPLVTGHYASYTHLSVEESMKRSIRTWSSTVAIIAIAAACSETPQPVSPDVTPQNSMSAIAQSHLPDWFEKASPAVLALPGTVFADNDEANNRLLFGVENASAIPGIQNALEHLGIPASAYKIEVTEPIRFAATLRDEWRPTRNGVQIHFGNYLCSLGFNALDGSERSFITASHCTNTQGGVEGTKYYQPISTVNGTVIATEVEDPVYVKGGSRCPRGKKCRYSDASRALYSSSVLSDYVVASTSGPNNGSLTVTGSFAVTGQDNTTTSFPIGTQVNKVGRTTGWTQGNVTNTCVDTNVQGSQITQLCQTFVSAPNGAVVVQGGDSGSGVFTLSGSNASIVGILWGGNSSGSMYVFSPLKQVRDELGPISAH